MTNKQILLAYLEKRAFMNDTFKKLVEPENTHKYVLPVLNSIFSHHTTAGLLGTGAGAIAGGIMGKKGKKLKSALGGAAAGGALGLGGSFIAPGASEAVNQFLVKHLVRKPVGRLATNLFFPQSYEDAGEHDYRTKFLEGLKPKDYADALINDKLQYNRMFHPSAWEGEGVGNAAVGKLRDPIYRQSFDLPPREYTDMFIKDQKAKTIAFNPDSESGYKMLQDLVARQKDDRNKWNDVLGNYSSQYSPEKGMTYSDVWDFDLHRDEGLNSKRNWMRYFMDRLINKQHVQGTVDNEAARRLGYDLTNGSYGG